MKLLFYINLLGGGGAERVIANLSTFFAENGDDVVLVTTYSTDNEYAVSSLVKRYTLDNESRNSANRVRNNIERISKLRKIIKKERPVVAISFMEEPNFRLVLATMGLPTKTIVSVRNDPNMEYAGKLGRIIAKWILPLADGCVFQTSEAKAFFNRRLQEKSAIIYNAVKEDFFSIQRSPKSRQAITCGRLQAQKNHMMLIAAFEEVVQEYPDAHLLIYGDGPLKSNLQEYINLNQLNSNVIICGNSNDIPSKLQEADIFVLSSDYEGMPNALMEAMAAGVPCVSTDCPCGGPRELITHGVNGFLVPVNDKQEMANTIKRLFKNSEEAEMLGKNARERAKVFSPQIIFCEWSEYIKKIVKLANS